MVVVFAFLWLFLLIFLLLLKFLPQAVLLLFFLVLAFLLVVLLFEGNSLFENLYKGYIIKIAYDKGQ